MPACSLTNKPAGTHDDQVKGPPLTSAGGGHVPCRFCTKKNGQRTKGRCALALLAPRATRLDPTTISLGPLVVSIPESPCHRSNYWVNEEMYGAVTRRRSFLTERLGGFGEEGFVLPAEQGAYTLTSYSSHVPTQTPTRRYCSREPAAARSREEQPANQPHCRHFLPASELVCREPCADGVIMAVTCGWLWGRFKQQQTARPPRRRKCTACALKQQKGS
jgi:hypothetical protein